MTAGKITTILSLRKKGMRFKNWSTRKKMYRGTLRGQRSRGMGETEKIGRKSP